MTETTTYKSSITAYNNYDPTRTTVLRNAFAREMRKRFAELTRVIRKAIVDEDCFGLSGTVYELTPPIRQAFAFPRNADKVSGFMEWLQVQVDRGILEVRELAQVGVGVEGAWTNKYVFDSYKRGVIRARYELQKAGFDVPTIAETGGIEISMSTPFHLDRVGLLYTRTFSGLQGITAAMDTQISRVLAQGIADGDNPRLLARKLISTINGVGMGDLAITDTLGRFIPAQRRAEMLARTEVIRAHHNATIQEYRNWAAEGVIVKAEWASAGDERACNECLDLDGSTFTLDEIEKMIPRHPRCRCIALPFKSTDVIKKEEWMEDNVAMGMKDSANGKKYYQYKQEYKKRWQDEIGASKLRADSKVFDESVLSVSRQSVEELRLFVEKDTTLSSKMMRILRGWQEDAGSTDAMIFKMRAQMMEKGINSIRYSKGQKRLLSRALSNLTEDEYLRIRAFNQAYMDVIDVKSVTLYRGTDGKTGKKICDFIRDTTSKDRTKWRIKDSSLVGYTDSSFTANYWGRSKGGVSIRVIVNRNDIIIHRDLFSKITDKFMKEKEWIIRGIDKNVDIRDMSFRLSNEIMKKYGEGL